MKTRIDKIPSCCANPNDLQAGDILIFTANQYQLNSAGHPTILAQQILNNPGGHKDTVHAAFVVEINGVKKIAHLRAQGFILDDVNIIKTTTHVYRPRIYQQEMADELNAFILDNQTKLKSNIRWRGIISFFSFIRRLVNAIGIKNNNAQDARMENYAALPSHDQYLSSWSICSKFLAETYVASCYNMTKKDEQHQDFRHALMNIGVNTIPKTLQSYLYRCSNYAYSVIPSIKSRGKLVENFIKIIIKDINRMKQDSNLVSRRKADKLEAILIHFTQAHPATNNIEQDFENAKELLKAILPTLKINTGLNITSPTSYLNVMKYAKSQGLYAAYFEKELTFNYANPNLTNEAKRAYQYSDEFAALYSSYRKKGFSDKEARFECHPTFTAWLKINKRRNTVAAFTVLPFLLLSLPIGISRVVKAKQRNRELVRKDEGTPLLKLQGPTLNSLNI
jgi:hypothetical protein